ncbi:hypothetical protein [Actinoplanes sp. G11-F43]|uniref:hypothetical protein n=1 Tax=Actinoplanes sp. G11-F43 TaxID=3424130 RepID=UPI003D32D4CA
MFAIHGDICHLCGHRGATVADHLKPKRTHPHLIDDPNNMRPAHGVKNQRGPGGIPFDARCQTCLREGKPGTCNGSRGAKPMESDVVFAAYVPPVVL